MTTIKITGHIFKGGASAVDAVFSAIHAVLGKLLVKADVEQFNNILANNFPGNPKNVSVDEAFKA
jgi:hypothetical protein